MEYHDGAPMNCAMIDILYPLLKTLQCNTTVLVRFYHFTKWLVICYRLDLRSWLLKR